MFLRTTYRLGTTLYPRDVQYDVICTIQVQHSTQITRTYFANCRWLVERADDDLWKPFPDPVNEHRRKLIVQVVTTSMILDGSTLIAIRMLL
jgi:hypothetical protein